MFMYARGYDREKLWQNGQSKGLSHPAHFGL
jgi:hypothetical protein